MSVSLLLVNGCFGWCVNVFARLPVTSCSHVIGRYKSKTRGAYGTKILCIAHRLYIIMDGVYMITPTWFWGAVWVPMGGHLDHHHGCRGVIKSPPKPQYSQRCGAEVKAGSSTVSLHLKLCIIARYYNYYYITSNLKIHQSNVFKTFFF